MKKLLVAAVIAGSCYSLEANAQERAGSAAIGAVSGAVVLGPVGAVAGALIGFTAGPAIARSWGVGHSASRSRLQQTRQATAGPQEAAVRGTPLPLPKPAEAFALKNAQQTARAPEMTAGKNTPPPQGFE
jgi:hypothetical protein